MFSRLIALAFLFLCAFSSCSLRVNDNAKKNVSRVNTGSGCLARAGDVLDRYHRGILSEGEHEEFFGCLEKAFTTFTEYADGTDKNSFAPTELSAFLSKFFLNGKTIQPELAQEAMELKRAMIGGGAQHITREELRRTIALIRVVKEISGNLRPYMPFSARSFAARNFEPEQFELAMRHFEDGLARFGQTMQSQQGDYAFDHLAALVRELRSFLYSDSPPPSDNWTNQMLQFTEAIRPAKAIFISPPRNEILGADWPKIYHLAPRYFVLMLRAQFYLSHPKALLLGPGLARLEKFYDDFKDLFETTLENHPGNVITAQEIDDLLETFAKQRILPCQPATARAFIKVVFGRLLGEAGEAEDFAISMPSLSRFRENFRFALEGLRASEAIYRQRLGEGKMQEQPLTRAEISSVPNAILLEATRLKNHLSLEAIEAVKRTPFEVGTVFPLHSGEVVIPQSGQVTQFTYFHLARMHVLRSLNRLVADAYGTNQRSNGLSEAEVAQFANDILPVLEELQIVGTDARASISKRLFEASLFLYASDGDRGLTGSEALELEALVLSTVSRAPRFHQTIAVECQAAQADAKGDILIDSSCFRAHFLAQQKQFWAYIPGFAEFFATRSAPEQEEIFARLEAFLRKGKKAGDAFTLSDTQSFILLPYYIELLFSRFDKNQDGFFDLAEADSAYPVFHPFIAEKAKAKGYTENADHEAIFNFLLAYRLLPSEAKVAYAARRYLLGKKDFRVDRGQVIEIFEKLLSL